MLSAIGILRWIWIVTGLLASIATTAAQTDAPVERFTAFAVNMAGNIGRTGAQTVEIVVNRWSTDTERDRLLSVLQEQGPDKLLDALQAVPRLGYIRTPDSLGYEPPLRAQDCGGRGW